MLAEDLLLPDEVLRASAAACGVRAEPSPAGARWPRREEISHGTEVLPALRPPT